MSHKALPLEVRATRRRILQDAKSIGEAHAALLQFEPDLKLMALESWATRNGLTPGGRNGAAIVRATSLERLEAAEVFADRVAHILADLPENLTGPRAALALGEIKVAVADYVADVGALRGMSVHPLTDK